ncbi:unnamed protein product [Peniophora sp. CBMAI 1063]|nr:unnamed protein product [Peniophora sp. CBMAI 1063]
MSDKEEAGPSLISAEEAHNVPSIPDASVPLTTSYTYHSPTPTASGPYILGVDEAGRGPVLGPLVYGVSYCPAAYKEQLEELGFADSKTLTAGSRSSLLDTLCSDPPNLGWSVRVMSPQDISAGMLRRPPINLNKQSQDATILLIREVLQRGIELSEIYVDALGPIKPYEQLLSSLFPGISITVAAKADSKFKIVGAASVAAKVTRDAWIEGWLFDEEHPLDGKKESRWKDEELGSGYPSDPKTKAWIQKCMDRTFGYPGLVRFSWTTVKVVMEKETHKVAWMDDENVTLAKSFASTSGLDKGRSNVTKDLGLSSVSTL